MRSTPQEEFWAGEFGTTYTQRNRGDWSARVPFWRSIVDATRPRSILEVGCNRGNNLKALRDVDPSITLYGCDINLDAIEEAHDADLHVVEASVFELGREWPVGGFDLVFTVGVLIHIAPDDLHQAMANIIGASARYVLAVEYPAEQETEIEYRGHSERLWKRPFGDLYRAQGLKLVSKGEAPAEAFDRCAWWLLEKGA